MKKTIRLLLTAALIIGLFPFPKDVQAYVQNIPMAKTSGTNSKVRKVYQKFMKKNNVLGTSPLYQPSGYYLYDLDKNGVEELFFHYYAGGVRSSLAVCTYKKGKVRVLDTDGGSPRLYKMKKSRCVVIRGSGGAATYGYTVYTMKKGILRKKNYVSDYGKYTLNGKGISKKKFKKFENKLTERPWKEIRK